MNQQAWRFSCCLLTETLPPLHEKRDQYLFAFQQEANIEQ
jgi:hypothetical protein